MKSSMPRHHWRSGTALVLPAVRRLLHCMNKERVKPERLFRPSKHEGLHALTALSGVQMRGEVPSRVPGSPLDGSRLSRTHSEGFGRGTARQKRVAGKGRALMQRFCHAFASAGVGESRSVEDVEDDDSGAVCLSCYLSREARMRGCDAQAAVWTGGDYGVRS